MSPQAIDRRLQQAAQLRQLCLSLAGSSAGRQVMASLPDDPEVQRTARALGMVTGVTETRGELS